MLLSSLDGDAPVNSAGFFRGFSVGIDLPEGEEAAQGEGAQSIKTYFWPLGIRYSSAWAK
jgi:hypothetical protein